LIDCDSTQVGPPCQFDTSPKYYLTPQGCHDADVGYPAHAVFEISQRKGKKVPARARVLVLRALAGVNWGGFNPDFDTRMKGMDSLLNLKDPSHDEIFVAAVKAMEKQVRLARQYDNWGIGWKTTDLKTLMKDVVRRQAQREEDAARCASGAS
jgi:hypothetical protein